MSVELVASAWRTPLGDDLEPVVNRLLAGERAANAELRAPLLRAPAKSKHARFLRRMALFGHEVATEAWSRAGLKVSGERVGVFCGYGGLRAHWDEMMPALEQQREALDGTWERGLKLLHPWWMLRHLSNNAHALVAADLGIRGDGATFGGANGGAQALAAAERALEAGGIDAALVFAFDSLLEPETLATLPLARGEVHAPYDERANGFVPGEAATAIVLRPLSPDGERARVRGKGEAADRGAVRLTVLNRTPLPVWGEGTAPSVIDGAALATREVDDAERAQFIGSTAPLTATQAAFGQLGAAAALVQAIALAHCLLRRELPPIAGLKNPAPGPLSPVTRATRTDATTALALSFGQPRLHGAVHLEVRP